MVDVAPGVVPDRGPDRVRHLVEAMQQVLDRELGELDGSSVLFRLST
jgi:hypothetical protein